MSNSSLADLVLGRSASNEAELFCTEQHPIHLNQVRELHPAILSPDQSQRMAEFFGLLGDANRLRILSALALKELCVCDLAASVGMSESAVSHQLRSLKAARVVAYRKQGRKVYYRLKDNCVLKLYQAVAAHLDESDP